jgi:NAD-dependent dihydropyrimidine dehydrogenase PreA subunit
MAWVALLIAGCSQQRTLSGSEPSQGDSTVTDIHYQVGPCHGMCPVYSVDLNEDGTTRFHGEQFTALEGERVRVNDPERFARIEEQLSAWQPPMGTTIDTPDCGPRATDLSHYTVTWTNRDGEKATLKHDSGCHSEDARRLTEVLRGVPQTVGIEAWVER